jgi:hypothetical protein
MGLLMPDERRKLLRLLLQIPGATDPEVRHSLLAGLPDNLVLSINFSNNAWTDFNAMINVADSNAWARLSDGSRSIIMLINNAMMYVSGASLEQEFQALRDMLEDRRATPPPSAHSIQPSGIQSTKIAPPPIATTTANVARARLENLTGKQYEELLTALLSAFEDFKSLEQMVRFGLDQNLSEITGETQRKNAIFKLIDWAIAQGRLKELVVVAHERVPGNPQLRVFADKYL